MKGRKAAAIAAAMLAAVIAFTTVPAPLRAEAAETLQVSDTLVGEGKLIEKTDGLTRLSDSEKTAFLDALDKKYAEEIIEDYSGEARVDMKANVPVEQLGGAKMGAKIVMDVEFADSERYAISMAEGKITVSVMFLPTTMYFSSYTDKENQMEYRKTVGIGDEDGWTKARKESENECAIPFLYREAVRDIYRDPGTGNYAAVVDIDEETISKMTGSGIEELEKAGVKDADLSKGVYIATLDKGVSIIGMYADLSEAVENAGETSISQCTVKAVIKSINSGLKIVLPQEAVNAKERKE